MHFWFQSVASSLKPSSLYHKSSSGNAEPLNQGFVCTLTRTAPLPRDIWQCLEIFWWVGRGQGFCYEYPTMHTGQPSTTKNLQPKMTVMPQVRKSVLKKGRMMSCPPSMLPWQFIYNSIMALNIFYYCYFISSTLKVFFLIKT